MSIEFRPLWTIEVRHAFHGGACDDLQFLVPGRTRAALAGARAIARERGGRLHVLAECTEGRPIAVAPGQRFVFGLAPRDARFHHYTLPLELPAGYAALYRNRQDANALDAPLGVALAGDRPALGTLSPSRPRTLRLLDEAGEVHWTHTLGSGEETTAVRAALPVGAWGLEESGDGPAAVQSLFVEPDLATAAAWGVLDLTADAGHLDQGATFILDLQARSDLLRYYVVAQRYSQSELDALSVQDTGFADDARGQVPFARVLPAAFGGQHLPASLLDAHGSSRIVLFEAQAPMPRRARGARGIGLRRNGDILIDSLPQPGADRPDAQFIVHLSKP